MPTIAEKIAVMQAYAQGADIEFCPSKHTSVWCSCSSLGPWWDWINYDYRVFVSVPKPKPATMWVNCYAPRSRPEGPFRLGPSYKTKVEADKAALDGRIACVPITVTEGEGL